MTERTPPRQLLEELERLLAQINDVVDRLHRWCDQDDRKGPEPESQVW